MRAFFAVFLLVSLVSVTACQPKVSDVSTLTGRWTGVEGTWAEVSPTKVTISNLDGPTSYDARAENGAVVFERDGQTLTIKKGSGDETGMKWLAGKKDCIVVAANEGYCRD